MSNSDVGFMTLCNNSMNDSTNGFIIVVRTFKLIAIVFFFIMVINGTFHVVDVPRAIGFLWF